ncbi:DUF6234 family protein [Streptomyces sp. I05A-00742]|uniref:DUF6234 family protein n=1 Tax=Streptomyces sp. I05A-00742 TaxID=2732853 RepID=UPI001489CE61|nr:DUF6234 family protein [Streptomyces sp. I05A-00742]
MSLPVAPPVADTADGSRRHHRANLGADIGAGCGLVFLELIALVVIFGLWWLSWFNLDPESTVEGDPLWGYLIAAGGVGVLSVVAAGIAARARAMVTVVSQGVMATLICVITLGGVMAQNYEDTRAACRDTPSAPACDDW